MREIKFRAWYKRHNKMYTYVEHVTYPDGSSGTGCIGYLEGERMFSPDDNEAELMQYTGLKDSKGQEIYEGDIIKTGPVKTGRVIMPPFIGRVYWFEQEFQWWITDGTNNLSTGIDYDLSFLNAYQDFEVIGNIYEHKHLLPEDSDN